MKHDEINMNSNGWIAGDGFDIFTSSYSYDADSLKAEMGDLRMPGEQKTKQNKKKNNPHHLQTCFIKHQRSTFRPRRNEERGKITFRLRWHRFGREEPITANLHCLCRG